MTDRKWHFVDVGANDMVGACGAPLKFSARNYDGPIPSNDMGDSGCSYTPGVNCNPCRNTLAFKRAENERQAKITVSDPIDPPDEIAVSKEYAERNTIAVPQESKHIWHSPSYGWGNIPEVEKNVTVPKIPVMIITNGEDISMFDDGFKGPAPDSISPITLASYIARLRALADILENK